MTEPASEPARSRFTHYSVSVRVQRVTVEDAFVLVPVDARVARDDPDGISRMDGPAVMARAVEIAASSTDWRVESQTVTPHPMQSRRPDDRTTNAPWVYGPDGPRSF